MVTAGGIAAIVAAVATVVTLVLALRWRRPMLDVAFPVGFGAGEDHIALTKIRVTNAGAASLRAVVVEVMLDGEVIAFSAPYAISPGSTAEPEFRIPRPSVMNLDTAGNLDLRGRPLAVRVRYGRQRRVEVPYGSQVVTG